MTTHRFQSRIPSSERPFSRCVLLLALAGSAAALSGCGAKSNDSLGSTDTGNPPAIDQRVLHIEAAEPGSVLVTADAGGVSPAGIEVTVTNVHSGASSSTDSNDDGSFEVTVAGTVGDEYEVSVGSGAETDTVVLGADGATDPNDLSGIVGKSYLMQSAEGFTLAPDTMLRIGFDEAQFFFSAGCNGHGGEYSFCDGKLCLTDLSSTAIGCDEPRQTQDAWLADFFTSTPGLARMADQLTVTGSSATLVFLDTEAANPDRPLSGRVWSIHTLIQGEAASSVPMQSVPTLEFSDDGIVSVSDTCVVGTGNYEVNGETLVFEEIAYPEEACAETVSEVARDHIRSVIQGEVSFSIDEARLWLNRGDVGLGATTE